MNIFSVISLLGGLAMFLYGMEVMGDGLKNASGPALKSAMSKATQNVVFGVITGTLVTAVIQSSTATIVLAVGLISAGILNLRQAVGIVMGANIGTTVTAQIIRLMDIDSSGNIILEFFKPSTLAPLSMFVGILLIMFIKRPNSKTKGEIFMGFGVLFSGIMSMTAAVSPLSESPQFAEIMAKFSNQPILAILVGLVLTVIVQSSSAMVGMLQALSVTGTLTFKLVYPMIMGINLGTCVVTLFICSIGSSKDAKRTGIVHILFNTIGTILFMIVMEAIRGLGGFPELWGSTVNSGSIANFQTLFNLVTAIALIPFADKLVNASLKIIKVNKEEEEDRADLPVPDEKLYGVPELAISEANKAISNMGYAAVKNLKRSCKLLEKYDEERAVVINENEDKRDLFTDTMDNYLVNLSKNVETDADNQRINAFMQTSTNFERIGDHAINVLEASQAISAGKIYFSETAKEELALIEEAVFEIADITMESFKTLDVDEARRIEPLEEVIDDMVITLKNRHIERLKKGGCTTAAGIVFMDIITNLERVADQCSNVALLILSEKDRGILGNHHAYLRELHQGGDIEYDSELERRKQQYLARL